MTTNANSWPSNKPSSQPLPQGARRSLSEDQLKALGELRQMEGWVVYQRHLEDLRQGALAQLRQSSDHQQMLRAQGELDMVEHIQGLFRPQPSVTPRRPQGGVY